MKNKALVKAIIIILLAFMAGAVIYKLFWSTPTDSNPPSYPSASAGHGRGQGFGQIVKQLNFSDEQITAFSTIENQYRNTINLLIAKMDSLDRAIITELTQKQPNQTQLAQMALASGETQHALKKRTIEHFLALREICTPAQLREYKNTFQQINQFRQGLGQKQNSRKGRGQQHRWGRSN